MDISYDASRRLFHLHTDEVSYAFAVNDNGKLVHVYWGKAMHASDAFDPYLPYVLAGGSGLRGVDQDSQRRLELRTQEPFDYGEPTLMAEFADGVRTVRLVYESHEIKGDTLTVLLKDEYYPFQVELQYKTYGNLPLISRNYTVKNLGEQDVRLTELGSATWHLPAGIQYRMTHQAGNWGSEHTVNRHMLTQSRTVLQNTRVTATTAQQTPFFALDANGAATETSGEVYYGVLHWSGDFKITVEQEYMKRVSVSGGINDFDTAWTLHPGERFETPLFTCGFSARGFERMTEVFYDWQLDYLCPRGKNTDKAHAPRPVIYNSWYPYEFSVNEENLLALIDKAADIGTELFVIDDGWMPKRVDAHAGLGDWVADPARFPNGLKPIVEKCHAKGMMFGLWVEPEMVNPDSDLYRAHPDWVIREETRPMSQQRNQYVLNLARDDVRDWAIQWLDKLMDENQLDYLKWDMNRYVTEKGWPGATREERDGMSIRYTQNLLAIWKHMNESHPDVLFENCASGSGRCDFGMVPYADRINRSDNADPVDIMVIHEGFSMLFLPKTAGGAGNIAPQVHHIHGRATPLSYRVHWGMTGSMSIGIDLLKTDQETLDTLKAATDRFKQLRGDLQDSYVYRIASATEHPYALFQYVRRDRKAFTLFAFAHGMRNWDLSLPRFRMRGLLPNALYRDEQGKLWRGEALMNDGITLSLKGDYDSKMLVFTLAE